MLLKGNRWYSVKVCFHHKKYGPKSFFLGIVLQALLIFI